MNNRIFFGLLLLAAAVIMVWFAFKDQPLPFNLNRNSEKTNKTSFPTQGTQNVGGTLEGSGDVSGLDKGGVAERGVVTYTDSGFGPKEITVAVGTTVTFVNESSRDMWVASGVYPSKQLLLGFDQKGTVARGGVYEYTFTKVGTWQYQNDKNPSDIGYIIVR